MQKVRPDDLKVPSALKIYELIELIVSIQGRDSASLFSALQSA